MSCEIQELYDCLWQIHGHHVWYLPKLDVIEPWDKRWPALSSWALGNEIVLVMLVLWSFKVLTVCITKFDNHTGYTSHPADRDSSCYTVISSNKNITFSWDSFTTIRQVQYQKCFFKDIISEDPTLMEEFTDYSNIIIYAEAK